MSEKHKDDHDTLVALVAHVGFLKETMENGFKDLKENYSSRIENHELRIVKLETNRTKQTTLLTVAGFLLSILLGLVIYHVNRG